MATADRYREIVRRGLLVVALLLVAACAGETDPTVSAPASSASSTSSTAATTTSTGATTSTSTTTTTTLPPTTTVPPRVVTDQAWVPFATVGGVTLHHTSARVERTGFHESNHDGAQQLDILATAVAPVVLETRERGTGERTAADMVVDPDVEIRSPVTGVVIRGGGYTLYCDHRDEYVVIEPDAHPGWEVKVLHIVDLQVGTGDRVVAGETVLAASPRQLPFESQVDETAPSPPAWPHTHIEVVDPTIPDRPTPGGGCS
jgi:hypothetical protein